MAFSADTDWYARSDGDAANGGGFSRASTGTNYANQASAAVVYTDIVIDAADNTKITSAAFPFTSAHVGNILNITSGTGFTVQRVQIVSVSGVIATCDKAVGTVGSTGGNGKLGGALASPAAAAALVIAGNRIWAKGSFTTAATITFATSGTEASRISLEGFSTTPGDGGQATITSTNAAATSVISNTGDFWQFRNLTLDGASLSLRGIYLNSVTLETMVDNCWLKGATQYGLLVDPFSDGVQVTRCLATGNGSSGAHAGFGVSGANVLFDRCTARDNGGNGFASTDTWLNTVQCIAHDNTLSGFYHDGNNTSPKMLYCTSQGNTLDGLRIAAAASLGGGLVRHNIFAGNAGYGIRSITTDYSADDRLKLCFETNAFYLNTLGARFQVPVGVTDIILTVDPFTDSAGADEDFGLNFFDQGGLAARGLALEFGLRSAPETSEGLVDAGAVLSGGGAGATTGLGIMRSLWRELTGEKYTGPVPDIVVDRYLQRGLEWLNQVTEYLVKTGAAGVTLVANQQEYVLDAEVVRVQWVELNGVELVRGDIEEWRRRAEDWRSEPAGTPEQWAVYGQRIVFRPAPSAAAVAAEATPVIRYVANPPDISTFGPEDVPAQDRRLPVYHAVYLWSSAYPDSALASQRAKEFMETAAKEAQFAQRDAAVKETRP